jgi:hypothetical protein
MSSGLNSLNVLRSRPRKEAIPKRREKFLNLQSSVNIGPTEYRRSALKFVLENPKGRAYMGGVGIDRRIILK